MNNLYRLIMINVAGAPQEKYMRHYCVLSNEIILLYVEKYCNYMQ